MNLSEQFDKYYHAVWQSGFIYRYSHLFPDIELTEQEQQEISEALKAYDDYKAGKSEYKPPLPKFLINLHRDRKREEEAWIAELGHDPTPEDRLRRYKPLFDAYQPPEDPDS